jgi:hypothetical protein
VGGFCFEESALATTFTVYEPQWVAEGGITGPRTIQGFPAPNALWRSGDFLALTTNGTITNPTASGASSAVVGPSLGATPGPFNIATASTSITQGVVTVTATASGASAAPALTYYAVVAYTSATSQTLASAPFIITCPAGLLPLVSVSATGEPAGFTQFTLFISSTPGTYWQQGSATNTGSTVGPAYPLANMQGLNKAAAGFTTNCFGMADCDSDAQYWDMGAPANKRAPFGAVYTLPPAWDQQSILLPVIKAQLGLFEVNLVQPWQNSLLYSNVGFNIDANTGFFVADNTQSTAATISAKPSGPGLGTTGDSYARVYVKFNGTVLI